MNLIPEALTNPIEMKPSLLASGNYNANDEDLLIELINEASLYILKYCARDSFKYKTVSNEIHDGFGDDYLYTDYAPIISITSLYDDVNRDFDSATLVDSDDYEIKNAETGLVRLYSTTFSEAKSSIQISYTAGYSDFSVYPNQSDQLTVLIGQASSTVRLNPGNYTASSLAAQLQSKLQTVDANFSVSYDESLHAFKFTLNQSFSIDYSNSSAELAHQLGFDADATSYQSGSDYLIYSKYPVLGIPRDLIGVCNALVRWRFAEVKERRVGKFSETTESHSTSFDYSNVPTYITQILNQYKRVRVR